MRIHYGIEKHLDILSAQRSASGDIEVQSTNCGAWLSIHLIEYELEWFIVFENPPLFPGEPEIFKFESFRIENQLDVYKLNAAL